MIGSFRHGTYEQVVQKLQAKIEKFSDVYDMLNTGRFGWDDAQKCLYAKNKPFLAYKQPENVFGKDQAIGRMVE
ncbi:hypothetical protein LXL04_008683 [Taraxacum kok-saghyz]